MTDGRRCGLQFCKNHVNPALAVIALIAVFNVVNSIAMSVSARMNEYGAMRAIGMSTGQMVRMVAAETASYVFWGIASGCSVGLSKRIQEMTIVDTISAL